MRLQNLVVALRYHCHIINHRLLRVVTEVENLRFGHHNHEVLLAFLFSLFGAHLFSDIGTQALDFILELVPRFSWSFDIGTM